MTRQYLFLILFLSPLIATVHTGAAAAAEGAGPAPLDHGLKLVMVEEEGCGYCLRWHAEVGPGYPKSEEGQRAPLLRRDRNSADVARYGRIVFTPTFILLRDGREVGRILGYPGADFFWSLLDDQLRKQDAARLRPLDQKAVAN